MLTIKAFGSAGAAQNYYSHDDYYTKEGVGIWFGKGAEELGLEGKFSAKDDEVFSNLLKGVLPDGQILGRKTKDGIEHRPGTDLTFSCPKSFSIQMLVYADKEQRIAMEKALINAVRTTLSYIEDKGYLFARKGHNGKERENLNKLIFSTFQHTTNRNLEPQAHVHCFLANAAKCQDGKYRSLSIDKLLNDMKNNKLLGQIFRNELALEAKKLNFQLVTKVLSDGSSSFELAHIHPKLISAFSTRRKEILALCEKYGVTSKEGRDNIVINSRKAKRSVTQAELAATWKEVESNVMQNIDKESLTVVPESHKTETEPYELNAKDLAHLCVDDVTYYKTVFAEEELLKRMLKYSIGKFSVREIHREIDKLKESGVIIERDSVMTTKELLDKEKQILKYAKASLGQAKPIIKEKHFESRCAKFEKRELAKNPKFAMNDQQKKALKHILTSKDKIIMMEGLPGVGKSTVLNAVRDISNKKVISLIGLGEKFKGTAPTASAAKTLQESSGVESTTLHSLLGKYQGYIEDRGSKGALQALKKQYSNTVVFLDEGSLVSTKMVWKLLKLQEKLGLRLAITLDKKQLGAVEAGKPVEQMLDVIPSVKLNKIVRQRDAAHCEAVTAASRSDIEKTFAIHDKNISEAKGSNAMARQAVTLYMQANFEQRENTLLVSPTRKLRDKINNNIRVALRKEGTLNGGIQKVVSLRQKDMTTADHRFAPSFKKDDVLKFNVSYKNGIKSGDYFKVVKTNEITNSLTLEKDGKNFIYTLKSGVSHENKFEVFQEINLRLQEGLKIKFTKNNKSLGLVNSETAIIQKLDKDNITLKLENGGVKNFPQKQLKHIDYGYCVTVHSAQGKTYDNAIAAIASNKWLNNQKSWLVTLSRHKAEFTAVVEDKNQLKQYLIHNKGTEISAIELMSGSSLSKGI